MEVIGSIFSWIMANYAMVIGNVSVVCVALIAIFSVIKGDQPEKFLQGVVDFLAKFSKK